MTNPLRNFIDRFLGRGEAAVTVPPLDGALKPNNRLEEAPNGVAIPAPDDLVAIDGEIFAVSGSRIVRLDPTSGLISTPVFEATGTITALAASPSGVLAVASAPDRLDFLTRDGKPAALSCAGIPPFKAVTALAFASDTKLLIAVGSTINGLDDWQRDLLDQQEAGEIWTLDLSNGANERLAKGLAFPNGLAVEPDGNIIVSESWAKQLIRLSPKGVRLGHVMEDLPGYPARIARSARGGYWLSVFAPRSQLIEFVLREPAYRKAMMEEVDKRFWVAPALSSGKSFHEPMQGGALKQMGILKPWAPTRSYGLVIELTPDFEPVRSLHSRAGGRRHGVTAVADTGEHLVIASKGGDEIVLYALNRQGG